MIVSENLIHIQNYSDLVKLKRIMAYILRFIGNSQYPIKRDTKLLGPLSIGELSSANTDYGTPPKRKG